MASFSYVINDETTLITFNNSDFVPIDNEFISEFMDTVVAADLDKILERIDDMREN
mgnify:CR=1 FL=1